MVAVTDDDEAQVIRSLEASAAGGRVTVARRKDQLGWYERTAGRARLWFRGLNPRPASPAAGRPPGRINAVRVALAGGRRES
jgi:hypothetical protein